MIEIISLEQFNETVNSFRNAHEKTVTNCFLMPDEITALSSEGKLFTAEYDNWLLILCDREDYSNLYYYTTENSEASFVKDFMKSVGDREIYMDVVSRMGRGDRETPERLINAGAAESYKTYQRMQLPVKNIDFDALTMNVAEGYRIVSDYCDYKSIAALWKDSLDERSTPLPLKDELLKLRDEGNLLTVLDVQENLAAVIMTSVTAKQALLQHLVVSKQHRRKGLAISLLNESFLAAREKGLTMLRLWVDCQNSSAITLYDRLGFEKDGMICDQLYMKG